MPDDATPPDPTTRKAPDPRKFWVVWSPQGGPPVVRFPNFEKARGAASFLSKKHPERDFFVLVSCWGKLGTPAEPAVPVPPSPEPEANP
jgi:hypothetical protein